MGLWYNFFFKVISSTSAAIINLMVQIIACVCVYTRVIVKFYSDSYARILVSSRVYL